VRQDENQDAAAAGAELDLVTRIRAGDRAAWGDIYDAHAARLYRAVLLPRLGDPQAAEDALSETFRAAIERFEQYEPREVGVYYWLSRIAHNKAMDMHRRRALNGRKIADLRDLLEPLSQPIAGADRLLELAVGAGEMRELVERTLSDINPRYRRAIVLRFFEEREREDCAQALEVKLATFDVVLLRALRAFRERWEQALQLRKERGHEPSIDAALA